MAKIFTVLSCPAAATRLPSGLIAKVLTELNRLQAPETSVVLSILVLEDLAMAVYLPLIAVLLAGGGPAKLALSELVAIVTVLLVIWVATRYGLALSRLAAHQSDEIVLLTTFGTVLLVAGLAERVHVSSAIGAFLVGIAASGPIAEQSHRLLAPFRDFFAALFFFLFGLQIDPAALPKALPQAAGLAVITALTKALTGYWAARRNHLDASSGVRAGMALVARGEFSIVIAGLGAGLEQQLGPLSAAYVLFAGDSGAGTSQGREVTARLARSATKLRVSVSSGLSQQFTQRATWYTALITDNASEPSLTVCVSRCAFRRKLSPALRIKRAVRNRCVRTRRWQGLILHPGPSGFSFNAPAHGALADAFCRSTKFLQVIPLDFNSTSTRRV